ncbi:MAG: M24 family metallopeptidase [Armatimonadota bacterium]
MGEELQRLERLRQRLRKDELDGLIVSAPESVFYLSGFRGSSGALLIDYDRQLLLSDFRYRLQAREQAPDFEFVEVPRRLFGEVGAQAAAAGLGRLGYDQSHLTCEQRDHVAGALGSGTLVPASGLVETLRTVKSEGEIERIAQAAALADRALARMVELLRPGLTEREIALEGEFLMRREGAEAAAFDIILASGPRSALPHAETTDRQLTEGDLVVIDIGARVAGYCSDMTRTFAVGSASGKAMEVYQVVYRAQRAAAARVSVGAKCGEVDAAARSVIAEAGYGDSFGHGLGHGVGIAVHEGPRLAKGEESELAAGNVVTVEPGIYLEGFGGVRLEDLLVVAQEGARTLTGAPMPIELPVV